MRYGDFEWDDKKALGNARKHGVTFREATTAFLDDLSIVYQDTVYSDRFVLIGMSFRQRLLVVVHAERLEGASVRIISARKANTSERDHYEEGE